MVVKTLLEGVMILWFALTLPFLLFVALNIRYAKGEISMEEYKSMKNEITSGQ